MIEKEIIAEFSRGMTNNRKMINVISYSMKNSKVEKPPRMSALEDLFVSGKTKLKDAAKKVGLPVQNLFFMYNALEKEGLITREIDPKDRRNTYYSITKKGIRVINRTKDKVDEEIMKIFSKLPAEDLQNLKKHWAAVNDIIEKAL